MVSREKFVADITARQEKRKREERRKQERTRFDVNGYFHESVWYTVIAMMNRVFTKWAR